jgi:hypothetical protein
VIPYRACVSHQRLPNISRATPERGPAQRPTAVRLCQQEVSAPERRNHSGEPAKRKSGQKPTRKADYHQGYTAGKASHCNRKRPPASLMARGLENGLLTKGEAKSGRNYNDFTNAVMGAFAPEAGR